MKRLIAFGVACCAAFLCTGGTRALAQDCGDPHRIVVTVNGHPITEDDLHFLATINPRIGKQLEEQQTRDAVIDKLVEQELLYQEALRQGLDRNQALHRKSELYRRVILAQAVIDGPVGSTAPSETEQAARKGRRDKIAKRLKRRAHIMKGADCPLAP